MYPYNKNQIANKENTKTQEKEKLFSKESKRLPTISSYHEKDLENCSLKYNYEISPEEQVLREKLFKWVCLECRTIDIKINTIEHITKLFDLMVLKNGGFFQNKKENTRVLLGCILISSKYIEIYPPSINDVQCIGSNEFTKTQILMTEKEIITKADFCVDIGLAYDWYKLIFKKEIPEWICEVLPSIKPHVQARKVAETVFEVDSLSFENKGKGKYFSKNSIDKKKIDEVIKRLKNL